MTFREFIQLWETNWWEDPEHIWFGDPMMTRFLSPQDLAKMMHIATKHAPQPWKNSGVSPEDDPDLTQAHPNPLGIKKQLPQSRDGDPDLTLVYSPNVNARGGTHSGGQDSTMRVQWSQLIQDLQDIKQRLARLENGRVATQS